MNADKLIKMSRLDGDWKLCVKTGAYVDGGTSANVTFYACGLDGSNSGNVILQGGADGKFEPGKTVKFKVLKFIWSQRATD